MTQDITSGLRARIWSLAAGRWTSADRATVEAYFRSARQVLVEVKRQALFFARFFPRVAVFVPRRAPSRAAGS